MAHLAYLSLGSNIEPEQNLRAAVQLLRGYGKLLAISSVWETRPVGFLDQANFLNMAVLFQTTEPVESFHAQIIRPIEHQLHRVRTTNPNAPRTIDLDLSLYDDRILTLARHQIPDPDILTRAFVAIPLAEVAPTYRHPQTGQTLAQIAAAFDLLQEGLCKRQDIYLD
ncbi:MAG: 2-amino-4-hydroxy-6-hydroxymethyldihydropteridine diphosphokinase [Anaerolineales bacterium]